VSSALLAAAHAWHDAGCCVVPARADGTKAPWSKWKQYQEYRSTPDALDAWFTGSHFDGLGLVCGQVSGNLEMFEIEGRAAAAGLGERLAEHMRDNGLGDLWRRITDGYLEQTPSGGYHWLLRIDGACRPPTKLASSATGECLIETKGEGGFTIVAPSGGRTHPSGQSWVVKMGSIGSIPTVTEEERDALYAIATLLDESPPAVDTPRSAPSSRAPGATRPGDDFNTRADWADILTPHGWGYVQSFSGGARGWVPEQSGWVTRRRDSPDG
jgi:putative DNA primase/helicase